MAIPPTDIDYSPGSFGCHEALHMADALMEMVDGHLCQHPSIQQNVVWSMRAEEARQALFDLYQMIGAEHLKEPE